MKNGSRFIEAYPHVLHRFGHNHELRENQTQSIQTKNQKAPVMLTNYFIIAWRNLRKQSFFFFSSRRRHTSFDCDWSSDVCSSDLAVPVVAESAVEVGLPDTV